MNTNQKKLKLIKEGFRPSTLQYLSDKQVNALFTRLLESKKEPNEVQTVTSTKIIATPDEVKKGVSTQGKSMAKMLPDGKIEFIHAAGKSVRMDIFNNSSYYVPRFIKARRTL